MVIRVRTLTCGRISRPAGSRPRAQGRRRAEPRPPPHKPQETSCWRSAARSVRKRHGHWPANARSRRVARRTATRNSERSQVDRGRDRGVTSPGFQASLVLQDGGGKIARKDFRADEDERGRGQQRQDTQDRPVEGRSFDIWTRLLLVLREHAGRSARRVTSARSVAHDFSQAFSRSMPLSRSKPLCGVWPPMLVVRVQPVAEHRDQRAARSLSISCIAQI